MPEHFSRGSTFLTKHMVSCLTGLHSKSFFATVDLSLRIVINQNRFVPYSLTLVVCEECSNNATKQKNSQCVNMVIEFHKVFTLILSLARNVFVKLGNRTLQSKNV